MKRLSVLFSILVIAIAFSLSGCGNNVVGPTAPEVIVPASSMNGSASDQLASDTEDVNASCHATIPGKKNNYNSLKHKSRAKRFVKRHIRRWLKLFYLRARGQWYFGPPFRPYIKYLLFSNKVFAYLLIRHRLDQKVASTAMEIISHAYQSGDNTNPGNFNPEVTLMPFEWKGYCKGGFDNQLRPGWKVIPNSTNGYLFETKNANNDLVGIDTKSYQVDVYNNEFSLERYRWNYAHDPVGSDFYKIEFDIQHQKSLDRIKLDARLIDLDSIQTIVELWQSTEDYSGSFRIRKTDGEYDLNLSFDAVGNGGGTLDILNRHGKMDHYEYFTFADGGSYWTKNNGPKIYF